MNATKSDAVNEIFSHYPPSVREEMDFLRELIFNVAQENAVPDFEECLKWGEPAYATKCGSTLRIDWKPSSPENYFIFFHCKTRLVETFKEIYPDTFNYSGNRAIILPRGQKVATSELKHCIFMSLNYHNLKHLPLLGA